MARTPSRKWKLNSNWLTVGKECGFTLSSHVWGGAERDYTNNGCKCSRLHWCREGQGLNQRQACQIVSGFLFSTATVASLTVLFFFAFISLFCSSNVWNMKFIYSSFHFYFCCFHHWKEVSNANHRGYKSHCFTKSPAFLSCRPNQHFLLFCGRNYQYQWKATIVW